MTLLNKTAVIISGTGTSDSKALASALNPLMCGLRARFPNIKAEAAFGEKAAAAACSLMKQGFGRILCLSTHIAHGSSYAALCAALEGIPVSPPLLCGSESSAALAEALEKEIDTSAACVFVAHGGKDNGFLAELEAAFAARGCANAYTAALKGEYGLSSLICRLGQKKVVLRPLTFTAGIHAARDIAVNWKARLEAEGFKTDCVLKGLGEYSAVRRLYLDKLASML